MRLWDGRIGRWLTTDPAGQHSSPYLGMGNNPITRVDPDGGEDWYADENGELEWHAGSGVREGLMWAAADGTSSADLSRIGKWLGGSGNVSGNELVFSYIFSIGNGWDDGLEQRGKDFVSFMDDPKGRTLQGVSNFVDGAGSFLSDFSESGQNDIWAFAGGRALSNMADMSLYDWSYAAGYSAPDIAFGFVGGAAFSGLRGMQIGTNLRLMRGYNYAGGNIKFQIGVRNINTNYHFRFERHKINGKFNTHFNYGTGGKHHWPSLKK